MEIRVNEFLSSKSSVVFTPLAWTKMWLLVDSFETEVAWNALCRRDDKKDDVYHIEDILVHKQKVTEGTVRTDPAEYDEWLGEFDDETFEKIRLHGHSHSSIAAFPSGLDKELQEDIASQLKGDMFYIFMIVNKRRDMWIRICDHKNGTDRRGGAVTVRIADAEFNSGKFISESKRLVEVSYYTRIQKREDKHNGSGKELRGFSARESEGAYPYHWMRGGRFYDRGVTGSLWSDEDYSL